MFEQNCNRTSFVFGVFHERFPENPCFSGVFFKSIPQNKAQWRGIFFREMLAKHPATVAFRRRRGYFDRMKTPKKPPKKPAAYKRRRGRPQKPDGRSSARRVAGLATSQQQLAAIDRIARRTKTTRPEALQIILAAGIEATANR